MSREVEGAQVQGDDPVGVPTAANYSRPAAVVAGHVPRSQRAGLA